MEVMYNEQFGVLHLMSSELAIPLRNMIQANIIINWARRMVGKQNQNA